MFTENQISAFAMHLVVTGCFKTDRDYNVMQKLFKDHFGLNYEDATEADEVHKTIQEVAYNANFPKS